MTQREIGNNMPPVRILIADDHPAYRGGLRGILSREPDLAVVAEAGDGKEAVELCRNHQPDLVLMDVRMPNMDGLTATREIKRELPLTIVLMLTAFESTKYLAQALRAGAGGYVLKYASAHELVDAIRGVLNGESPIEPKLAGELLLHLHRQVHEEGERVVEQSSSTQSSLPAPPEDNPKQALLEALSPRELEVLKLMARGQTNHEITQSLFISIHTVKKHAQQVVRKLGVSDRTQAILVAIELGLHIANGGA